MRSYIIPDLKAVGILLFLLLSGCSQLFGQYRSVKFDNLTISHGLSNNSINSILQTGNGFLWIATKDGLNRFDGQNFRIFKHNPAIRNSLPENYVMSLMESRDGTLWVGTWGGGLCKYDPMYETFLRYDLEYYEDDYIQFIYEDHLNNLWYGTTKGGLNKLNTVTQEITTYKVSTNGAYFFPDNEITCIAEDDKKFIWASTIRAGLVRLDPATHSIKVFKHDHGNPNSVSNNSILTIYNQSNKFLLLGTRSGIDKFDLSTYKITRSPGIPRNLRSSLSVSFKHIIEDHSGNIWAGTYDYLGLYQLRELENKVYAVARFQVNENDPNSLISNRIRWLYEDRNSNLWIGTEEGLSKLPSSKPFVQFRYLPDQNVRLGGKVVSSIIEGGNDLLWVGYGGSGFDRINLKTGEIVHHYSIQGQANSLSNNDVVSLYLDKAGVLWISTAAGGLNQYNPFTRKFKSYQYNPENSDGIKSNWVQQVLETRKNFLLVGTNDGLQIFDRVNEKFSEFSPKIRSGSVRIPQNASINALFEDSNGNIWIGTWLDGLYRYDPDEEMIEHYMPDSKDFQSLSSSKVTCINEDKRGFIWIGTHSGGLNKFDKKSGKFSVYNNRNGLPNDVVFGIQEDDDGFLWISTLNGLAKFDPVKASFRVYDESDGIISNTFNWRASLKSSRGLLYFGGANGFISFDPESITVDSSLAPIAFTSFKLFDKEATLPQSLPATKEIILQYNQNFFSIEFTTLDMTPSGKHKYQYMLEGIDQGWIQAESRTTAYYTDIDPGRYRFLVKSGNADNIWSDPAALSIRIEPAWWMTWWFKLIIGLFIIIAVFLGYKFRINQLLKIERLRYNIASDLHDEIGSNLSSICVDGQLLLKSDNLRESERELSSDISRTASQTLDAMRDIIWFINPKNDAGEDIVFKMRETAAKLLVGLDWSFSSSNGIRIDLFSLEKRRNIFLIYKEALTNVIRHSKSEKCFINLNVESDQMILTVRDEGLGFDIKTVKKNTGLLSMMNRAEKIKGRLFIVSSADKGTEVKLIVNLRR